MKKMILLAIAGLVSVNLTGQTKIIPYKVAITVSNLDNAAKWYEKNFDCEVYKKMQFPEYDSLRIYFLRRKDFEIELIEKKTSFSIKSIRPAYDINKTPLQGYSKIAFRIENVQQLFDKLKSNGVQVIVGVTYDKTFDIDFFIIGDMDGNLLEFDGPVTKKGNN